MNLGVFIPFRNPPRWQQPWPQFYAEQLDQIRVAEDLGYDEVWLTEHHFSDDGYSPALFPLAAAIAARTTSIRIGFYLMLLPLHHPVEVAESAVEVDILSNGRFDLGVGQGYVRAEFAGFGIPRRERAGRLTEGLEAIRGMWTQDPFSYKGTYYDLSEVSLHPKPVQQPHPPIWVGATAPRSVARVGKMGFHYLGLGDPGLQAVYDGALQEAGHDPADFASAHIRTVYVAEDTDQAWADTQDHLHYMLSVYARWIELAADFDTSLTGVTNVPEPSQIRHTTNPLLGAPLIGTPDVVAAGLQEMLASVRTTHVVLGMHLPGLDPVKTRRSMELFSREVMPAFR